MGAAGAGAGAGGAGGAATKGAGCVAVSSLGGGGAEVSFFALGRCSAGMATTPFENNNASRAGGIGSIVAVLSAFMYLAFLLQKQYFSFLCPKLHNIDMIASETIKITPVLRSRLHEINIENVPFGRYFTDHMLVAQYSNKQWHTPEIKPFGKIEIDPGNAALHYGQSIFEGIKAYHQANGEVAIFRPYDNFERFNISATRMQMPELPEEIFVEGMRQLIALDKDWVPQHTDHSLYIRPLLYASDPYIGVRPSEMYTFLILLSPTGPYYPEPMRIYVEEKYTRAAPGGVGYAKTAGNYAAAMFPTAAVQQQGFQQVLWTDATEHKYVQEIGTMNVFFVINGALHTPSLEEGTILDGITRKSIITLARELGVVVEERRIAMQEVVEAYGNGSLTEVFGAGTAATVSLIKELKYRDFSMHFDAANAPVSAGIAAELNEIRYGRKADTHGWMFTV